MGREIALEWLLPLLVAPFIGSFIGVLIRRLPRLRPVGLARSECESCGRTLPWTDLVPVASYLLLRRHCRFCRAPIGQFHLLIELAALVVAAWAQFVQSGSLAVWLTCMLGWTLLAVAWIDAEYMLMPDVLTLPLILLGLVATWLENPERMVDHALAAAVGYLAFLGIARLYKLMRGQEGLGRGDAKLLAAAGAWVGLAALPALVFMAALAGLVITLMTGISGRQVHARTVVPFGPFLAAALWLMWVYQPV